MGPAWGDEPFIDTDYACSVKHFVNFYVLLGLLIWLLSKKSTLDMVDANHRIDEIRVISKYLR